MYNNNCQVFRIDLFDVRYLELQSFTPFPANAAQLDEADASLQDAGFRKFLCAQFPLIFNAQYYCAMYYVN